MFNQAINYTFSIKSFRAGIFLLFIEKYVNAGILQYKRIEEARETIRKAKNPTDFRKPLGDIFTDIHFYFVCWDKVHDLYSKFCECVGGAEFEKLKNKYNKDFIKYNEARNHLEHIAERLMGKSKGKPPRFAGDLGNLVNDHYTFWGEKYYIGDKSLTRLKNFYTDLLDLIEKRA